ncbi:unnamed protein product, partial [Polarella glacialis]
ELDADAEEDRRFLQKIFDQIDEDGSGDNNNNNTNNNNNSSSSSNNGNNNNSNNNRRGRQRRTQSGRGLLAAKTATTTITATIATTTKKKNNNSKVLLAAKTNPEFKSRLRVMDIDEGDLVQMFEMLDGDGSGSVDPEEFINALNRWANHSKTAARFAKYQMMRSIVQHAELHQQVVSKLDNLEKRLNSEASFNLREEKLITVVVDESPLAEEFQVGGSGELAEGKEVEGFESEEPATPGGIGRSCSFKKPRSGGCGPDFFLGRQRQTGFYFPHESGVGKWPKWPGGKDSTLEPEPEQSLKTAIAAAILVLKESLMAEAAMTDSFLADELILRQAMPKSSGSSGGFEKMSFRQYVAALAIGCKAVGAAPLNRDGDDLCMPASYAGDVPAAIFRAGYDDQGLGFLNLRAGCADEDDFCKPASNAGDVPAAIFRAGYDASFKSNGCDLRLSLFAKISGDAFSGIRVASSSWPCSPASVAVPGRPHVRVTMLPGICNRVCALILTCVGPHLGFFAFAVGGHDLLRSLPVDARVEVCPRQGVLLELTGLLAQVASALWNVPMIADWRQFSGGALSNATSNAEWRRNVSGGAVSNASNPSASYSEPARQLSNGHESCQSGLASKKGRFNSASLDNVCPDRVEIARRMVANCLLHNAFDVSLGLIICLDVIFNVADIDARAVGRSPPMWADIGAKTCLAAYMVEFILNIFVSGWPLFRNPWLVVDFCIIFS